jgi:threonine aldolase
MTMQSSYSEFDFPFGLGSDNHSGVHPKIMSAMQAVNLGFAPSYGSDLVSEQAKKIFREHFGKQTDTFFCFNGTAANVLAIGALIEPFESVICSSHAHIAVDECGAPERILGCKLHVLPATPTGKITADQIASLLIRRGDQHFSQCKVVSITQPTEVGTVYSKKELSEISLVCQKNGLFLHIDGARLVNAAISAGVSLSDVSLGADVVSFGGTKNGLLFGEAVLFLSDRARQKVSNFPYIRKQLMQLPSKTRFVSAQFCEFLGTNLWQEIASHSLEMANYLRRGLEEAKHLGADIQFTQETQSNGVFVIFSRDLEKALKKSAFFYIWNEDTREARLMTSWNTSTTELDKFIEFAKSHQESRRKSHGGLD